MGFRGAIFDVDGVLVDSPHERAWREALQLLMETDWSDIRGQTTYAPERFTSAVYQAVMAGKPISIRREGAMATSDVDRLLDEWAMAWSSNEHNDPEQVLTLFAGDCVFDDVTFCVVVRGKRTCAAS